MPTGKPDTTGLITPAELPTWVPGEVTCESRGLGWKDVSQCSYRYKGQDVDIPPMETFMIVQYLQGVTPMDRKVDGRWTRTRCGPGFFSLLSREADTQWNWKEGITVSHVYLSDALMRRVARDVADREVSSVRLHDVLQGVDPVVGHIADQVTREASDKGAGGPLYAEALSIQLAVHLLRNYASCITNQIRQPHQLSRAELSRLEEFIDANLHEPLSIEQMADVLGLGVWTFNRHLKRSLDRSAYALVLERRIERAKHLLRSGTLPLKEIAACCGFSDQAHMTRTFRSKLGVTPGQFRSGS